MNPPKFAIFCAGPAPVELSYRYAATAIILLPKLGHPPAFGAGERVTAGERAGTGSGGVERAAGLWVGNMSCWTCANTAR